MAVCHYWRAVRQGVEAQPWRPSPAKRQEGWGMGGISYWNDSTCVGGPKVNR